MALKTSAAKQARSAARFYATQALFQMEASGTDLADVQQEYETHRFGAEIDGETWPKGDLDLFRALLLGAYDRQAKIDKLTDTALVEKWPIARIDPTLRAIFRAAGAEMLTRDTPPKVAISEYVDVAKSFFPDGKEPKLVNAVLDHMARAIHPEAFA